MSKIQMVKDPYDSTYPMLVDLNDKITLGEPQQYCETCKAWVKYSEQGRWTHWAGELDKWFCESHK